MFFDEWVNIALRRLLQKHDYIATKGNPESGISPILFSYWNSTANPMHCICTVYATSMTNIRLRPGFKPSASQCRATTGRNGGHRGRPVSIACWYQLSAQAETWAEQISKMAHYKEGRGAMARALSFANVTACRAVSNPAWCRIFREISCFSHLNIGTLFWCCVLRQGTSLSHASLDSGVNEYLVGQRWQRVRLVPSAEMAASAVCSKKGSWNGSGVNRYSDQG